MKVVAASFCFLVAGCASSPRLPATRSGYAANGAVSAELLDQSGVQRYQAVPGVSYSGPVPARSNAEPEYPAALLSRLLPPVTVTVRIVVDGEGAVSSASVMDSTSAEPAFVEAVVAAVKAWKFDPLKRVADGKTEALPFTQEYRFAFRQVDGRAVGVTPTLPAFNSR